MKNSPLLELKNPTKIGTKDKCHSKSLANNLATLTDKDLLALCQKYGKQAILWKRKFIGLLPEVERRGLYLKKRCSSIYEFAAKFGGVTKKHTQRVIQIDKTFEEKGVKVLREMLQEGAVSISKLIKVVSVVSVESESDLVTAVKNLSHESLETYVRDMRRTLGDGGVANCGVDVAGGERVTAGDSENGMNAFWKDGCGNEDGFLKPLDHPKSVRPNTFEKGDRAKEGSEKINEIDLQNQNVALQKLRLNLSAETLDELLELQGKGINIDVLLKEFLQNREENIAEKKEGAVREVTGREGKRRSEGKKPVRQISVKVKRILQEEYGTKCAVGGCNKAATQIHHTVPFSINGSNDPNLLKPLCRAHHDIVHSMNDAYLRRKFG